MRIGSDSSFDLFGTHFLAPTLSPSHEQPLITSKSIDNWGDLATKRKLISLICNCQPAQVADIFTDSKCAVDVNFGRFN